eukprot:760523-Hanusia_phi.AAC.3
MLKNGLCETFGVDPEPPAHTAASKVAPDIASTIMKSPAEVKSATEGGDGGRLVCSLKVSQIL